MSVDKSPVYNVKAVPIEKIQANDYNPNVVAPPEMKLLELSIWEDGFTMPCVCYYDREKDNYILDHAGMSDQWIMKNIGMDRDELLRLKQISGLADLFANKDFSIPDNKPEYIP